MTFLECLVKFEQAAAALDIRYTDGEFMLPTSVMILVATANSDAWCLMDQKVLLGEISMEKFCEDGLILIHGFGRSRMRDQVEKVIAKNARRG